MNEATYTGLFRIGDHFRSVSISGRAVPETEATRAAGVSSSLVGTEQPGFSMWKYAEFYSESTEITPNLLPLD